MNPSLSYKGGDTCQVWLAVSDHLALPGQFTVRTVGCNETQLEGVSLQPLCLKPEHEAGHGGHFLGYILQSLLSLHRKKEPEAPACPGVLRRSGGRCLLMAQELMTSQSARDYCHQQGLELLTVKSRAELEDVRRLVDYQARSHCEDSEGWWVLDISTAAGHSLPR